MTPKEFFDKVVEMRRCQKEGKISPYMDIEEITAGRKKAILMDNNILASNYGLQQIEKIINWVSKWILIKDWMLV